MVNDKQIRAPPALSDFLMKFGLNRIKVGTENKLNLSYSYLLTVIINYFKSHNSAYMEMVNMEVKKNG